MTPPRPSAPAARAPLRVVPQQARGRGTLAKLLAVADRLMAAEGAEAVTTSRVALEAGVAVGTVYRYLPNRAAVIEALARQYLQQLEALMGELVDHSNGVAAAELVDLAVDAFADFYRSHPGFRTLWFSRNLTEDLRALDRRHKLAMARSIRRALVASGVGSPDREMLAASRVLQLATDAVIQEAFRGNPRGDRAMLDQLKAMLRDYLAGPAFQRVVQVSHRR